MYILTAKVQKRKFFKKKSTKGTYCLIQFDEIYKMNGHKWGQISQTKKFIPQSSRHRLVLAAKVQIETLYKKSTKGIYFLIQFDEMCKMNSHK